MSAWADDPSDFAKHFEAAGGQAGGFAQRRFFGQYLRKVLDQAVESGRTIEIHSRAVRAQRAGDFWNVEFEDGSAIEAEALVLATGNQEPDRLKAFDASNKRFVSNPWGEDARAAVLKLKSSNDDAFILGTGLTMVDLVLSLDGSGFNGKFLHCREEGLPLVPMQSSNPNRSWPKPFQRICDLSCVGFENAAARLTGVLQSTASGRIRTSCGRVSTSTNSIDFLGTFGRGGTSIVIALRQKLQRLSSASRRKDD